jgi:hypothetical protein
LLGALAAGAVLCASPAWAAKPTIPPPSPEPARLTEAQAVARFVATTKVAEWLDRYPAGPQTEARFDQVTRRWTVDVWSGRAGEIATGAVDDATGQVVQAWTGPQVAWHMARGGRSSFGGRVLGRPAVWYALCAVFLLGLADLRRPVSLRNVDLVALLSFSVSLEAFDRGHVFASASLVYPPLVYLLVRTAWIGLRGRGVTAPRSAWPLWVLLAATVFLMGFRVGLNVQAKRSVIDVGYAGVIGASRIVHGEAPYGHMPVEDDLEACGPADAAGEIRDRIQTNGRCESANPTGDTYGPVAYLAYVPAVLAFGWSGRWDSLPAAHAAAIAWDLVAMVGLVLVGYRFGGRALATVLAFAWAAYPFTAYALNADTNDAIMPAILVWGFWLLTAPFARGAAVALSGWTKFAALAVAPLWLTYPRLERRRLSRSLAGFAVATVAAFLILLLEPSLGTALATFWHRSFASQITRHSPFSLWDWGQYHARGIPSLHAVQIVLEVVVGLAAVAAAFVPRQKDPLRLAALTAALLLGMQLVLTHWFYLYLPWVLPFVVLALFLPRSDVRPA